MPYVQYCLQGPAECISGIVYNARQCHMCGIAYEFPQNAYLAVSTMPECPMCGIACEFPQNAYLALFTQNIM